MAKVAQPSKPARRQSAGTGRARPGRRLAAPENHRCRIVLTGGPGGGKTTAADLFRREIGERVVIVPEAATLVFSGGFPRCTEPPGVFAAQRAIFHVQRNLEDVQSALYPERILLCDRGTVDGAAYWPGPEDAFFTALGTTLERELARYDGVIFFESAAVGGIDIEGGNPMRQESLEQEAALDAKLRKLWAHHPRFIVVRHDPSFLKKINSAWRSWTPWSPNSLHNERTCLHAGAQSPEFGGCHEFLPRSPVHQMVRGIPRGTGIDSFSLNPDTVLKMTLAILEQERHGQC